MAKARAGEAEFIAEYQRTFDFPQPSVTVDMVLFTLKGGALHVMLIRRAEHPFRGAWAIPGGFLEVGDGFKDQGEDLETAAARELEEETTLPVGSVALTQFGAFGRAYRDPRLRTVTVAYLALVPPALMEKAKAGSDAAEVDWIPVPRLPRLELAFDHAEILKAAQDHLLQRLDRSALLGVLLPKRFTRAELRAVHEAVAGRARSFARTWRRLQEDGWLRAAGEGRWRFAASARRTTRG